VSRRAAARLVLAALCSTVLSLGTAAVAAGAAPSLSATAAVLYAPQTGQILYGLNDQREVAIASTTKLMTALIVLQHVHHLGTIFTQNDFYPAAADSQIGLVPGERMSVHDLLIAMMLPSADDAAEDLADNVGDGSLARFVGMMNAEARTLGLSHTHYSTPIGLDTPGNYSTASDLVHLAEYDFTHSPYFARIVALHSAVLHTGPVGEVVNRNDLVGAVPWINGVKTGHTAAAGYVLVASGQRSGMTLISAVLGTDSEESRDANTMALLDYGFGDFALRTPVHAGQVLARPAVKDRPGVHAPLAAAESFSRVLGRSDRVRVEVDAPKQLIGPLPAKSVVGTAAVIAGGRVIGRVPLMVTRALPRVSGLTVTARILTRPLILGIIVLLAAGTVGLRRSRRRRDRRVRGAVTEMEAA
jgi:D-alanyl-D-alanine carboxypeptidase (penicillin-binding protein 5/6)